MWCERDSPLALGGKPNVKKKKKKMKKRREANRNISRYRRIRGSALFITQTADLAHG